MSHIELQDFKKSMQFNAFFDSLREGIIIWNSDQTLHYANESARRITGLNLTVGTPLAPILTRGQVLNANSKPADLKQIPVYRAFNGTDVPREDMRFVTPDGEHKWLWVSAHRILDESGTLAYVMTSFRDISVRKAREDKLEFMVESAKILQFDLDFKQRLIEKAKLTVPKLADWCMMDVVDENDELERVAVIHSDPGQIEQLREFERVFPRDDTRPGSVMEAIQTNTPLFIPVITDESMQVIARSPEHLEQMRKLNIRSVMVVPIVSHGKGVGAMTLAHSESGRTFDADDLEFFKEFCYHLSVVFDNARLFDEIKKRDSSKDIFLAALSHELRNPLAPIKSALELLKMRSTTVDIREDLDIIEHQFDHMARLLNDLLDVTRFTQDRISISRNPVELRRLTERALKSTDALIRKADITLHFSYPSGVIHVSADDTRMEQAISNLLSNAVKFTPAGGSIWVDLEQDATHAIIKIRDDGAGIDPSDLPKIFDMYYQGANKDTVNSGLGIGLLLVQRIVHMHGGTVHAESRGTGTGSEFVMKLPLSENAPVTQQAPTGYNIARGRRIIVVDDNAPAADALVRLLNKIGAQATAVYSGHEVLGSEQLHTVDLFLLDVGMPHMDGYELVRALRSRGITAPIVALTGYGLSDDKKRAQDSGFTSHLTKPVGLAELSEMFDAVLGQTA